MLTAIEATANCHNYDLHGEQPAETCEHCAALLVDGVDADNVHDWGNAHFFHLSFSVEWRLTMIFSPEHAETRIAVQIGSKRKKCEHCYNFPSIH